MVLIEDAHEAVSGDRRGILLALPQGGQHELAFALQGLRGEIRLLEDQRQGLDRALQIGGLGEAAQLDRGHLASHAVAELRPRGLEALVQRLCRQTARAFGQDGVGEPGEAPLPLVTCAPGIEGHAHVRHRQLRARTR